MEKDSIGQYGVHVDPRTAYQSCHELQHDSLALYKDF